MKKPKMPPILMKPANKPTVTPAFNPVIRERDMLKQAREDGSHEANTFQGDGV